MFAPFPSLWIQPRSFRSTMALVFSLALFLLTDSHFSVADFPATIPPYIALFVYVLSSTTLEHVHNLLQRSTPRPRLVQAATLLGAGVLTIPFHLFGHKIALMPTFTELPLLALSAVPLLSGSLLFLAPRSSASVTPATPKQHFLITFPTTTIFALCSSLFFDRWSFLPLITFAPLLIGLSPSPPVPKKQQLTNKDSEPTSRLLRSYLNTIISNNESRKIFYFLLLNLCFMLVQMLYGVWTNSLGLISDGMCV